MDTGERKLENTHSPLYGFTGNEVKVVGTIDLPVLFGTMPCQVWKIVKFHVISANSSHNAILGRMTISALKAITSIPHLKMKFPTEFRVGEMCGYQAVSRQCYFTTVVPKKQDCDSQTFNEVVQMDPDNIIDIPREPSFSPVGETVEVSIVKNSPDKTVNVGKDLDIEIKEELTKLLREFLDIFAWSPSDMPGIPVDCMMDEIFKKQLGGNLEVYVDDMIAKSKSSNNHCSDLRETFENVRRSNMRLNLLKCSFGLTSGKFLGFLVSQ
ncbi:uncharacterized protein LOC141689520 [Apium graveolens]|uniref:uncharacterized protein LOC141689520 n=1 Tax=Apium graveolens TaxID=4045 RepID=UPI003D7A9EF0